MLDVHRGNTEVSTLELSSLGDFNRYITIHHQLAADKQLWCLGCLGHVSRCQEVGSPPGSDAAMARGAAVKRHMVAVIQDENCLGNIDTIWEHHGIWLVVTGAFLLFSISYMGCHPSH